MGGRGQSSTNSRMPRFRNAYIARSKIMDYLLSPKNTNGKAAYFKSLGYTTKNAGKLKRDILDGLKKSKALVYEKNRRGDVSMSVIMTLGLTRREEVVTAWVIEAGGKDPHLVTAYPRERKR